MAIKFKNPDYNTTQQILHSPFDIRTHQENFINYLEIIILPDGTIEYAVPSHVLKLTAIYGKSSEDLFEEYQTNCLRADCHQDMFGIEPADYLCRKTGCLAVYSGGYTGTPNPAQIETLQKLKDAQLYVGSIPDTDTRC